MHRMQHQAEMGAAPLRVSVAIGLRRALAEGYGRSQLRADVLAGIVVGLVALPLSMALAIASGAPPQHGIYTAIVSAFVIAPLGGSRVQVSGPTAAFVVILSPITTQFGLGGLMLATVIAGLMLAFMGLARLGRLIEFIPYPVTTGFTAGIAIVIATIQVKDFLGLTVAHMPDHYVERIAVLASAMPTLRWQDLSIGLLTLAALVLLPRVTRKVPSPLLALPLGAIVAYALTHALDGFSVATINSRFNYVRDGVTMAGIPSLPPLPSWPWSFGGPNGQPFVWSFDLVRSLVSSAFAIAMLGAIESLLSAVVADGMTGRKHDPDAELLAQGVGNVVAPFFGGFAATGAIARTATNIRSGGTSPVSAVVHGVFLLAAVLALAPLLGYLPMASLAALLFVVAWNMFEVKHVLHVLRIAPRSDVFVLALCIVLTVLFDMVVSVTAGVILAAVLFMQRMAEVSGVKLVGEEHPALQLPLPSGVMVYDVAGPLFFGAAAKAMSALATVGSGAKCVVLDLEDVPAIDATGLVNLESALAKLHKGGIYVILAGVQPQPALAMAKAGLVESQGRLSIRSTFDDAVALARAWAVVH